MDFIWFQKTLLDKEGKPYNHPLFTGYERVSEDGTMFMLHRELMPKEYAVPKTSVIPTKIALSARNELAAICVKEEVQTKTLMATAEWTKAEVAVYPKPVEEIATKG